MDVSKYRTRFPPREHEEAVRMLLEGLDRPADASSGGGGGGDQTNSTSQHDLRARQLQSSAQPQAKGRPRRVATTSSSSNSNNNNLSSRRNARARSSGSSFDSGSLAQCDLSDDYDDERRESARLQQNEHELDFNSEESSSQDQIQVSPQVASKHFHARRHDCRQPSPSRPTGERLPMAGQQTGKPPQMQSKATSTTASESQLSSGSSGAGGLKSRDANVPSGEPAELIPSRTIAVQCDLKLSSAKRDGCSLTDSASSDPASMRVSSISSTRYGFYKLSPETLDQRRRLARSISSRNIARPSPDETEAAASLGEWADLSSLVVGDGSRGSQVGERAEQAKRLIERLSPGQKQLESRGAGPPRRPKTALSYASSKRLRGQPAGERSASDSDEPATAEAARRQLGARAMSHQLLSAAGRERHQRPRPPSSSSGSDLGLAGAADRYRVPCNEELVLTRRGQQAPPPCASPATNYSAARAPPQHAPVGRPSGRAQTLTAGIGGAALAGRPTLARAPTPSASRGFGPERVQPDDIKHDDDDDDDDDNQEARPVARANPALGMRANHVSATAGEEPRKLARYSSMSLARTPARATASHVARDRSCDLISAGRPARRVVVATAARNANEPLATGGLRVSNQLDAGQARSVREPRRAADTSAGLARSRGRSASQQTLPDGQLAGGPRYLGAETLIGGSRLGAGGRLGRCASVKQAANNVAAGLSPEASWARPRAPPLEQQQQQQRRRDEELSTRFHSTDCESCCCEQSGAACVACSGRRQLSERRFEMEHDENAEDEHEEELGRALDRQQADDLVAPAGRSESEDSASPRTRTWANPSWRRLATAASPAQSSSGAPLRDEAAGWANARSRSMRQRRDARAPPSDGHEAAQLQLGRPEGRAHERFEHIYRAKLAAEHDSLGRCQSEAPSDLNSAGSSLEPAQQALDFDSQRRLNAIGLPEPVSNGAPPLEQQALGSQTMRRSRLAPAGAHSSSSCSSSHLGSFGAQALARPARYATTGRRPPIASAAAAFAVGHRPAITGRAMSQQSLTRPTMPLSRRLRRSGLASGSQSGASEVGGSSMSLAGRMRFENAHTRSPVVMYIPQAMPAKSASSEQLRRTGLVGGGSAILLRKSARQSGKAAAGASRHSSAERAGRRSWSRQASDSETSSSSMLRTLVKPRASAGNGGLARAPSGRRARLAAGHSRKNDFSDHEMEDLDGVGQLASELDSYKFRRRYSVPKDAKINWFSKLKQRVSPKS